MINQLCTEVYANVCNFVSIRASTHAACKVTMNVVFFSVCVSLCLYMKAHTSKHFRNKIDFLIFEKEDFPFFTSTLPPTPLFHYHHHFYTTTHTTVWQPSSLSSERIFSGRREPSIEVYFRVFARM